MTTECVFTECTEMLAGNVVEGDVLPDPKILEVVLVRTSLQISARTLFTVGSITSCSKEDCKPERRRYFHQLMLLNSWLINLTLLHRHHQLKTATLPTRRQLISRAAKQPKRHHYESVPLHQLTVQKSVKEIKQLECQNCSVSAKRNWKKCAVMNVSNIKPGDNF